MTSTNDVQSISERSPDHEIEIHSATDSGYREGLGTAYSIGETVTLDVPGDLPANGDATIELRYFERGHSPTSVTGEDITVTVYYADGSSETYSMSA